MEEVDTSGCARAYTERGWAVLPVCAPVPWPPPPGEEAMGCTLHRACASPGKVPAVAWQPRQTRPPSREDVGRWFLRWRGANIGILLQPSCLVVVDCDSGAAIAEAEALGLPAGAAIATSGKGRHCYFALPAEAAHLAGRRTTKRGESHAIDVLAGGIVIAPPSRHASGRQYFWLVPPPRPPEALPPAPPWALEMLAQAAAPAAAAMTAFPKDLPRVDVAGLRVPERVRRLIRDGDAEGRYPSRSEAVFAVATALVEAGCDDATIAAVLLDPANAISEKPRKHGRRWAAAEIARARAKAALRERVREDGPPLPAPDYALAQRVLEEAAPRRLLRLLLDESPKAPKRRLAALVHLLEAGVPPGAVLAAAEIAAGGEAGKAEYRRAAWIAARNAAG